MRRLLARDVRRGGHDRLHRLPGRKVCRVNCRSMLYMRGQCLFPCLQHHPHRLQVQCWLLGPRHRDGRKCDEVHGDQPRPGPRLIFAPFLLMVCTMVSFAFKLLYPDPAAAHMYAAPSRGVLPASFATHLVLHWRQTARPAIPGSLPRWAALSAPAARPGRTLRKIAPPWLQPMPAHHAGSMLIPLPPAPSTPLASAMLATTAPTSRQREMR